MAVLSTIITAFLITVIYFAPKDILSVSERVSADVPRPTNGTNTGLYSDIAKGADGNPIISYLDITNGDLKVAKCQDPYCSSGNYLITAVDTGTIGRYTSIAIAGDNLPVISYYDETNKNIKILKCGNQACNSSNNIITLDSSNDVGMHNSLAIGSDGLPIVSYWNDALDDIKIVKCLNQTCTQNNVSVLGNSYNPYGPDSFIANGSDGLPIMAFQYTDSIGNKLGFLKCGDLRCLSGNKITFVDQLNSGLLYPSVAIGSDGLPVISYLDWNNKDLKFLKCSQLDCSNLVTNKITVIGGITDIVKENPLPVAIGLDGMPTVTYVSLPTFDIRVVKCLSSDCTLNSFSIIPVNVDLPELLSLTISQDGIPIIPYHDALHGDLKIIKCGNSSCGTDNRIRIADDPPLLRTP